MMTFNMLEYCRALELPLVFSSTREVYGDVHRFDEYGEAAADFAYTESPYSASKIASEAFIYSYAKCYGLRYLVFRFSNVYGRYDNDLQRMERVLPLFMHKLGRGEPITVYGGDEKVLDFTYIDDCIDGIARGVERLAAGRVENETINLAYGQGNTLVRAAELIAAELDVTPEITKEPSLVGEVTRYVADIRKARELLDWEPRNAARRRHPARGRVVPRVARRPPRGGPAHRLRTGAGGDRARLQAACLSGASSRSSVRPPPARRPSPKRSAGVSVVRSSRPTRPRSTRASPS